jgi:uncharacterized protein (DUF305 family)
MRTTHRITLAVTGLATAFVLAACGGQSDQSTAQSSGSSFAPSGSSSASASEHNDADVTFAQMMIVHHQQAIEMADLAPTRASNPQVKDLAAKIKPEQAPEIDTMTGWLSAWGAPAAMSGMDHGGHDVGTMPGAMSSADMDRLASLSGSQFDREFLTMMIAHHQGAIDMAKTEETQGANPDAKALAAKIIQDQTAEIAQMQTLLSQV